MSVSKGRRGGRTRWDVRWREEGRQQSRTFDRREDADRFEADVRRRLQLGAHGLVEPSREPLDEWLRHWWERDAHAWAASTRMQRGHVLDKWIVPFIGGVRLKDLGPARVREWRSAITRAGCSPGQVNAATRVLSAALGAAVPQALPSNPCTGIGSLPVQVARPRALTPDEIERIRGEMPSARDALMVSLMGYAGLRPEEVVALRWRDAEGGVIVVDRAFTCGQLKGTKSGARRTVEIVAPLAADLAGYRPHVADPDALIAPARGGGFLYWGNWRNRAWNPACLAAGVKAAPYDLRHSFASLLIHEGRNPLLVSAALGHASGELVWRRYGHVFDAARLAPTLSMVEAIEHAREDLRRSGVRSECDTASVRVLRSPTLIAKNA